MELRRPLIVSSRNHTRATPIVHLLSTQHGFQYVGFGVDLLDLIFSRLNMSYKITFSEDECSGQLLSNLTGNWSGVMGQVVGKADMAIAAFSMGVQRFQYVDFSVPFKQLGIAILHMSPTTKPPSHFAIFKTFSWQTWLAVFLLLGIFCLSMFLFTKLDQLGDLSDSVWFCLTALLRQGFPPPSLGISNSVTAATWWVFTLILSTIFTANFTTYLSLPIYDVPFNNFQSLVGQNIVKFGFHSTGSIGQYLKTSPASLYRQIWHKVHEMNKSEQVMFPSNAMGIDRVLNSRGKFAFIMDTPPLDNAVALNCALAQVGNVENKKYWAIVMQKGSHLRHLVNREMIYLMERGILDNLDSRWLYYRSRKKLCKFKPGEAWWATELSSVAGVFVLYGNMYLASSFIFVIEFVVKFYVARRFYNGPQ